MDYPKSDYKEYPKTLPRDDFWGQVRRSQHGKRITETEVQQIVDCVLDGLELSQDDAVLDLACGNGALSSRLFGHCRSLYGVDFSEYLIEIAKENFERPTFQFETSDVGDYVRAEGDPMRFTRVLCYGSFSYFPAETAHAVLDLLAQRFGNVTRMFIGNLPDSNRANLFFPPDHDHSREVTRHDTQIGIWRTEEELRELARECGWQTEFRRMPADFFNARYRYDAILMRA